jgi:hypothetical protein
VARQDARASTFTLYRPPSPADQAWLVPLTAERTLENLESPSAGAGAMLDWLRGASALAVRRPRPERLEARVQVVEKGVVLVAQLAHPEWRAWWEGPGGLRPARILPAFARPGDMGWQAVETPGPGPWTLRMEYDARDVRVGLGISAVSGLVWALSYLVVGRFASHSQGDPS